MSEEVYDGVEEPEEEELSEGVDDVVDDVVEDSSEADNAGADAFADELSDEELDNVADTAIEVLRGILSHFDAHGAEINEYEGDDRELILDVVGGDLGILIGRRGRTLDSLQILVSALTRKRLGFRYPVTIDVESYKHRQRQKIESLAYSAASRAFRQDRDVNLRPMNPYERRLVHMALRDDERVETHSVGKDPERYIVISPV